MDQDIERRLHCIALAQRDADRSGLGHFDVLNQAKSYYEFALGRDVSDVAQQDQNDPA